MIPKSKSALEEETHLYEIKQTCDIRKFFLKQLDLAVLIT